MVRFIIILLFFFLTLHLQGQVIYNDAQSMVTGTWSGAGSGGTASLAEITNLTPHEGTKHYHFQYNFTAWWAGIGLNLDNWGVGAPRDFSTHTHLRLAFRGLSAGQTLTVVLRNGSVYGNTLNVGTQASVYTVVEIPIFSLVNGTSLSAAAIREINFSIASSTTAGAGEVFLDAIELVTPTGPGGPAAASATTMARAASITTGINAANWLEAYWMIPFNAYPEVNRFNRAKIYALRQAGFSTFRLPITVERLGSTTAPYTINFNQQAFALVDSMVVWANEMDFKLILVNHHGYPLTDANYVSETPRLQAVWTQMINRYNYLNPERYFFEIYNEPTTDISNANFRTVATNIVASIRAQETQTHSLFVGAANYNSGNALANFTPLSDPDIIYTFHCYDPYLFTHQGMSWTSPAYFPSRTFPQAGEVAYINQLFASVKSWSDNYAVPVSLGEYGASTAADATSRCNWIETLTTAINANGFSSFYWDATTSSDAFGIYTDNTIDEAHCITCFKNAMGIYSAPLSLDLISAEVNCDNEGTKVYFEVNSELEYYVFTLEYSQDGKVFTMIHDFGKISGKTSLYHEHKATHPNGYYRMKMEGADGKITYSPISAVDCASPNNLTIFPNPALDDVTIQMDSEEMVQIALYNMTGGMVYSGIFEFAGVQSSIRLSVQDYPKGIYVLTITGEDGGKISRLLVVQ